MANVQQHSPEIDEQIQWVAAYIIKLGEEMKTDPQDWMVEDLRQQKAIYQSLCAAKWMIEANVQALKKEPGNEPPEEGENILDQEFKMDRIEEVFVNIKRTDRTDAFSKLIFSVYGKGGFKGDVYFDQTGYNTRYYIDNFPGQKIFRACNFRIKTFRDFYTDLLRAGFEIEVKQQEKEVSNG